MYLCAAFTIPILASLVYVFQSPAVPSISSSPPPASKLLLTARLGRLRADVFASVTSPAAFFGLKAATPSGTFEFKVGFIHLSQVRSRELTR